MFVKSPKNSLIATFCVYDQGKAQGYDYLHEYRVDCYPNGRAFISLVLGSLGHLDGEGVELFIQKNDGSTLPSYEDVVSAVEKWKNEKYS